MNNRPYNPWLIFQDFQPALNHRTYWGQIDGSLRDTLCTYLTYGYHSAIPNLMNLIYLYNVNPTLRVPTSIDIEIERLHQDVYQIFEIDLYEKSDEASRLMTHLILASLGGKPDLIDLFKKILKPVEFKLAVAKRKGYSQPLESEILSPLAVINVNFSKNLEVALNNTNNYAGCFSRVNFPSDDYKNKLENFHNADSVSLLKTETNKMQSYYEEIILNKISKCEKSLNLAVDDKGKVTIAAVLAEVGNNENLDAYIKSHPKNLGEAIKKYLIFNDNYQILNGTGDNLQKLKQCGERFKGSIKDLQQSRDSKTRRFAKICLFCLTVVAVTVVSVGIMTYPAACNIWTSLFRPKSAEFIDKLPKMVVSSMSARGAYK